MEILKATHEHGAAAKLFVDSEEDKEASVSPSCTSDLILALFRTMLFLPADKVRL
jgi:hypothetical protein